MGILRERKECDDEKMSGVGRIRKIQNLLTTKQISCVELTKKYLKEIDNCNEELNAYVEVTSEAALETAKKVDEKVSMGLQLQPLEGVPMSLKDNILTKGIKTTCCSNMLKNYVPNYDATVWSILKAQNAVLLGKTNMDEFAMGCSCKTSCCGGSKNPHDLTKVPGGSSGGSAAAVCANISPYSLGTDTGGSIRQPASFCGIVGLKPTYGAFSRYGVVPFADSLDQVGPMAATVEDIAIIFDSLAKKDPLDKTSVGARYGATFDSLENDLKGVRIGLPRQYFIGLDEDVTKAIDNAICVYKSLGAQFVELDMPIIKYSLPIYYALATSEGAKNLKKFDGITLGKKVSDSIAENRSVGFGDEVKRRLLLGTYMLNSEKGKWYLSEAKKIRVAIVQAFEEAFSKCDVILSSTVPSTATPHDFVPQDQMQSYMSDICTVPANMAGLPAVSVPCGVDSNGLPIGMQLIGNSFCEATILNVARQFEVVAALDVLNKVSSMGVDL